MSVIEQCQPVKWVVKHTGSDESVTDHTNLSKRAKHII